MKATKEQTAPVARSALKLATTKTELAMRLGYARNTLYAYMRLPGFPTPDRRGQWNITACRKFIARQDGKRHQGPSELDALELEYRKKRNRKIDLELGLLANETSEAIAREILSEAKAVVDLLAGSFKMLPQQETAALAMATGADARELFDYLTIAVNERLAKAHEGLAKIKRKHRRKDNVIPIHSVNGNGSNGNGEAV